MPQLPRVNYTTKTKEFFDEEMPQGKMKRVALDMNGQVQGVHDKDDTNKWADGTPVNWSNYLNNGWNCMVQIPKFYYRAAEGEYGVSENVTRIEISETPVDGFSIHPAFVRNDKEQAYQYVGAFASSLIGGKYRSLPSKAVAYHNTLYTIKDDGWKSINTMCSANGYGYRMMDVFHVGMLQCLMSVEFGDVNAFKKFGGVSTGGLRTSSGLGSNGHDNYSKATDSSYIDYRGIESVIGRSGTTIGGMHVSGTYYVYITGNKDTPNLELGYSSPMANNKLAIPAQGVSNYYCYYDQNKSYRLTQVGRTGVFVPTTTSNSTITRSDLYTSSVAADDVITMGRIGPGCIQPNLTENKNCYWGGSVTSNVSMFKFSSGNTYTGSYLHSCVRLCHIYE
ncbi:hypothetical protein [Kurthia sp. Dielmo]|uniref:hypothetical protein n=1 Tax=Kurthia sp. Dielmo TaxID=1033738 RepID=UPI001124A65C|nr:hypothetical protein [Kurthia sp. Dielmo]